MILVAGLLAFTSVWGQNTTSGWEDESGKIPVKAYFESGKLHFASKNENFHLWFDNRIYLDAAVYSPTSNVDDLTSKTNKDLEDDDNQFRFSNGVSIRRARFGVKATLYKKWFAELDLDFAYNEVEIKDMYLGYKFNNHLNNIILFFFPIPQLFFYLLYKFPLKTLLIYLFHQDLSLNVLDSQLFFCSIVLGLSLLLFHLYLHIYLYT